MQRALFVPFLYLCLMIIFIVNILALFVLYPYLTIHMRELGINVEETAIMSAVTPVVSIVMPPLAGMLADKIGNFRVSMFSSCLTHRVLLIFLDFETSMHFICVCKHLSTIIFVMMTRLSVPRQSD